jgi:hypothetical protein
MRTRQQSARETAVHKDSQEQGGHRRLLQSVDFSRRNRKVDADKFILQPLAAWNRRRDRAGIISNPDGANHPEKIPEQMEMEWKKPRY